MHADSLTILLLSMCLGMFFWTACSKEVPEKAETIYPVRLMTVPSAQGLSGQTFPGKVRAARRVDLSFRVSGPLVKLPIEEGQLLKRGDLVARILPRDFETDLKQAKTRRLETEQQFRRYNDLYARNQVSKADLDKDGMGTFVQNVHKFLTRSSTSGFLPDATNRVTHELVTPKYRAASAPD